MCLCTSLRQIFVSLFLHSNLFQFWFYVVLCFASYLYLFSSSSAVWVLSFELLLVLICFGTLLMVNWLCFCCTSTTALSQKQTLQKRSEEEKNNNKHIAYVSHTRIRYTKEHLDYALWLNVHNNRIKTRFIITY